MNQRQLGPVGHTHRLLEAPPYASISPAGNRLRLCLPAALALDLADHLRFWGDVTGGKPSVESDVEDRFELAVTYWAAELLMAKAALWLAPSALNRLSLPISQGVLLYESLRTKDHTSSLARLRDQLHKLLV